MPTVSEAQHRAMEAAAEGKSTLGIPQSVGKEFVEADEEHWITTETGSHLLIEGNGNGGYVIKGGAGGKLDGQKVFPKSMSENRINEKTSSFNNPDFKPYESAPFKMPAGHETLRSPLKIKMETEKAYGVETPGWAEAKSTSRYDVKELSYAQRELLRNGTNMTWLPKSHSHGHEGHVVSMSPWLARKQGLPTHEGDARQTQAFETGKDRYAALLKQAKDAGVPGVRERMKTSTIKEKMRAHGIKVDSRPDDAYDDLAFSDADDAPLNELETARAIASGELPSPQRVVNMSLFAIRITGTGTAYRSALDEFVYRPPEHYLNQEFLDRCAGLAVIYEHPEKRTLNSEEFADRVVGSIMFAYLQNDEVWGIAKIYDDNAIEEMSDPDKKMSTSPTVVFRNLEDNSTIELDNGKAILIEGKPSLLDHVAICARGVWDKGGEPAGVLNNSTGAVKMPMTEEEMQKKADEYEAKSKADADEKESLKKQIADMQAKMDAMAAPAPMMAAADKKKADAEAEAEAEAEAKEAERKEEEKKKADAARADAEAKKARADAELTADVALLKASLALTDADRDALASAQIRADSVASAFGERAPAPLLGESVPAYRRRLLSKFKAHSTVWKDIPSEAIADAMIELAEKQIYADAAASARNPASVATGSLREIRRTSAGGHQISEFVGDISAFTGAFKPPVRRFVQRINNENR